MASADKIREFITANITDFDRETELANEDNIFETGFVDSSFALQLIAFIEEQFDIEISDKDLDLENFNSIERMIRFIDRKRGRGANQ